MFNSKSVLDFPSIPYSTVSEDSDNFGLDCISFSLHFPISRSIRLIIWLGLYISLTPFPGLSVSHNDVHFQDLFPHCDYCDLSLLL